MIRTSVLVLALLAIGGGWAAKLKCRDAVPDFHLKQRQLNAFVDTINKPIVTDFKSTKGNIDVYDLKYLGHLPKNQPFSLFDARYYKEARQILKLLSDAKDFDHFLHTAEILHGMVNEDMLYYCLSVVVLHRNDTQGLQVPAVHRVYPDKFLKIDVIQKMKELVQDGDHLSEMPIIDTTEESINYKNKHYDLNYFLEDIGMNSHHHQWHVLYPAIVELDTLERKGEMFYWMHKQMLARYDAERFSNGKAPVKPFINWEDPIKDGYAPHLRIDKMGYRYAYRPPNMLLKDLKDLDKEDMLTWGERLLKAADLGIARASNGTIIDLCDEHGIEIMGDMVESSLTSINREYYGNLHSYAHVMAGKITDPKDVHSGHYGVMYDVPTSARDPLFYAWHKYINRIFEAHKNRLTPYTREELDFANVQVKSVKVMANKENVIRTYWQESILKVPKGFEFTGQTTIGVKVRHLQHEPFNYVIEVENGGPPKMAVVRIYGLPNYWGPHKTFNNMRKYQIELDIFTTKLESGMNKIVRAANESNLITPWNHVFKDYTKSGPMDHCSCGWPEYMQIPKGTYAGMPFYVTAVVNDWDQEKVEQEDNCHCKDPVTYCGDVDRHFPYKKALGFPFDRKAPVYTFDEWATPNMRYAKTKITFTGKTLTH